MPASPRRETSRLTADGVNPVVCAARSAAVAGLPRAPRTAIARGSCRTTRARAKGDSRTMSSPSRRTYANRERTYVGRDRSAGLRVTADTAEPFADLPTLAALVTGARHK